MKAIKLASIFAVSAVAAAVSTTTFAAEAVFSGEAGIEYTSYYGNAKGVSDLADGTDNGEVELVVDTGVVYAEIEIAANGADEGTTIGMEKLYVKQGAVSFGRFDGTVATGAFMGMDEIHGGVDLRTAAGDTDNTGVRYVVAPGLTVALEATTSTATDDSDVGVAASYVADLGGFKAGISAGSIGDANSVNLGFQVDAGAATISANYGTGEQGTGTTTDVSEAGMSVAFAASDALTLTLEYAKDLEGAKNDGTYFVAEYTVGDLTYSFKNYNGDLVTEKNVLAVKAFF
ncbi:hypothetical protein O1D97_16765 [Marinomonas sp. 15G1-11]|uniref:Porin n=1 Tax=Marinomonas phaeophyticola TaxID=3004091 RepID=A0ABT4JXU7_9GAMM|nr:hypothetical protein [Marinomonas sp. 15G1-11]MCZ2723219.1 hypothetical protein [Marinomonas sp. 15G1-11]